MEDMLLTEQEGVTGPDDMMMRLVQQLQEQLHDLEQEEDEATAESEQYTKEDTDKMALDEIADNEADPRAGTRDEGATVSGKATAFETEPHAENVRADSPPSAAPSPAPPQADFPDSNSKQQSAPESPANAPPPMAVAQRSKSSPESQPLSSDPEPPAKPKSKSKPKPSSKRSNGHAPQAPLSSSADTQQDLDAAISQLIQGMAQQASMDEPLDDLGLDSDAKEADLLNLLMKGLQGVGSGNEGEGIPDDDFNADAMIDGMMEQLLSKVKWIALSASEASPWFVFVAHSHLLHSLFHQNVHLKGFNVRANEASCHAIPQVVGRKAKFIIGGRDSAVRTNI
jgi:hypothetical protein